MKRLSIRLGIIGVLMAAGILAIAQAKRSGSGEEQAPLGIGDPLMAKADAVEPSQVPPQPVPENPAVSPTGLPPMGIAPSQGYEPETEPKTYTISYDEPQPDVNPPQATTAQQSLDPGAPLATAPPLDLDLPPDPSVPGAPIAQPADIVGVDPAPPVDPSPPIDPSAPVEPPSPYAIADAAPLQEPAQQPIQQPAEPQNASPIDQTPLVGVNEPQDYAPQGYAPEDYAQNLDPQNVGPAEPGPAPTYIDDNPAIEVSGAGQRYSLGDAAEPHAAQGELMQPNHLGAAPPESAPPAAPYAESYAPVNDPIASNIPADSPPPNPIGAPVGVAPVAASQTDDIRSAPTPGDRQLEGKRTPFVAIEKRAPQEIRIGQPASFEIIVRNAGQVAAQDVTVIDQVPEGTEFIDATPEPQQLPNGTLVWSFGALEPGQDRVVTMRLMPRQEGEIGSVAKVVCQAQASVRTVCTRPDLQIKQTAPAQVLIGDELQVLIEVSNPGTGAAEDVILQADIPAELVHRMGRELDYNIGTLQPNESRTVRLHLAAEQVGVTKHAVRAKTGNIEQADSINIEVIAPTLQTKIHGPAKRYLRREASFELELANPGTATARDIQAVVYLPPGLEYKSASHQGRYQPQSHAIHWRLEELPKNSTGKVQFAALPVAAGDQTLRSEARGNLNTAANSDHTLSVESLNELVFTVADVNDPIEVGSETTYEVRVTNNGSKTDGNVEVVAQLPEGMRLVNADGPTQYQAQGQVITFAPLARLAPNGDAVYRLAVQGSAAGDHRLRVQIRSQESPTPVTKEEVTRVYLDR